MAGVHGGGERLHQQGAQSLQLPGKLLPQELVGDLLLVIYCSMTKLPTNTALRSRLTNQSRFCETPNFNKD